MSDLDDFQKQNGLVIFELDGLLAPKIKGWKKIAKPGFYPQEGTVGAIYGIPQTGFTCIVVKGRRSIAVTLEVNMKSGYTFSLEDAHYHLYKPTDIDFKPLVCNYGEEVKTVDIGLLTGPLPIPTITDIYGGEVVDPAFESFLNTDKKQAMTPRWKSLLSGLTMLAMKSTGRYTTVKYDNPLKQNMNPKNKGLPTSADAQAVKHGMVWNSGKGSLDFTINQAISSKHTVAVSCQQAGGYFTYSSLKSRQALEDKILELKISGTVMTLNEVLIDNTKFVADLDWACGNKPVN